MSFVLAPHHGLSITQERRSVRVSVWLPKNGRPQSRQQLTHVYGKKVRSSDELLEYRIFFFSYRPYLSPVLLFRGAVPFGTGERMLLCREWS